MIFHIPIMNYNGSFSTRQRSRRKHGMSHLHCKTDHLRRLDLLPLMNLNGHISIVKCSICLGKVSLCRMFSTYHFEWSADRSLTIMKADVLHFSSVCFCCEEGERIVCVDCCLCSFASHLHGNHVLEIFT